jgi:hypothetical protein
VDWLVLVSLAWHSFSEAEEGYKGFAQVGHIVYINLREQLLPYKWVLGRILLDKIGPAR